MKRNEKFVISEETWEAIQKSIFIKTEGRTVYRSCVIFHRQVAGSLNEGKSKAIFDIESPDESVRKKAFSYLEGLCPGGKR